jgi:hypothetical protein
MFRLVFARWGLPRAVRVDNGFPWGTPRDLPTELALWLIGVGVEVIWNPPAQPQKNPKVERCQGVAAAWAEPHTCETLEQLIERLDWVGRTQREDYPSICGKSRVKTYQDLLSPRLAYDPSDEPGMWSLDRVDRWLSQCVWVRRVGTNGVMSMYGHRRSVGRDYRGQDVVVRFDQATRHWVTVYFL